MIVITIRMEAEKKVDCASGTPLDQGAPGVNVELKNTQIGRHFSAALRPGETVEHRLHLDASGVIDLQLLGWSR